ncbi:MAG: hypothetical protein KJ077_24815 [Anaerolineae bacterium]|nr:hypothetical protein [Anaerolineae bacterium]
MAKDVSQQRRQDLEDNIRDSLELIKQYEDKHRLSNDPKEQKDSESQIADQRRLLERYRAELAGLEREAEIPTVSWPTNIPDERYYPLPGREHNLDQLLAELREPGGAPVMVIDGLGGVGKTAMTVELARRALREGLFVGAVGDSAKQELFAGGEIIQVREATLDFKALVDAIARQLGRWEITTMKEEEKGPALNRVLRQQRYLVLVDNLETADNATALVANLRGLLNGSRAIVSSRKKVRHDFIRSLSLSELDRDDAVFFLRTDAQQRGIQQILNASAEKLNEIHQVTGGAPLAMKLVVAQAGFLDLDLILRQLRQAGGELYPYIFRQSWEQMSPGSQQVLIYIGRTVVTTVSWEELAGVGLAGSEPELLAAIDQLTAYSLLDVLWADGRARYGIHQLTRQFINSDLPQIWREQGLL